MSESFSHSGTPASLARTLMVQGTSSSVGKSLLVAGLCRYFRDLGLRVAPFKSQNMALNSFATVEGLEIGRAQAVQAMAAGVVPSVDMNPILLKPTADSVAQVVVMGKPIGSLSAAAYHDRKRDYGDVIAGCLSRLRASHDVVVIEGAGSPAEINLRERDIVNMFVAELADAPVLMAGDIDRGGVFAALVGTLALLTHGERERVKGLIVNKFRGDLALFVDGRRMLEELANCPVIGVVPYLRDLNIAEEDSVALETRIPKAAGNNHIDVAVVMFPYLSNYDDVLPLEREPGVNVRFVGDPEEVASADLIILPGSKSTRSDLLWLRDTGLSEAVRTHLAADRPVLGICGGYQMLGRTIDDPNGVEGTAGSCAGLGLLPCTTKFEAHKITRQRIGKAQPSFVSDGREMQTLTRGYEIHMGRVIVDENCAPFFVGDDGAEGCVSSDGQCAGTLMHGLLDDDALRAALIAGLRRRRGLQGDYQVSAHRPDAEFDRLAQTLRDSLDLDALHTIVGLPQ